MPRTTKLTEERSKRIIKLIEEGAVPEKAAQACGISDRSFYRYKELGRNAEDKCEDFEEKVETWNELSEKERRANPDLKPKKEDEPSEQEYLFWRFFQDCEKAAATAEQRLLEQINIASAKTWQAAAWVLERRFGWNKTDKTVHEGSVQHEHQHQLLSTTPEAIEAARARLEAARAPSRASNPPQLPASTPEIEAEIVDEDSEELSEQVEKDISHQKAKSSRSNPNKNEDPSPKAKGNKTS